MSATYPNFFVKLDNLNYGLSPVSGVSIKVYNVSTQTDLGVMLGPTGSDGKKQPEVCRAPPMGTCFVFAVKTMETADGDLMKSSQAVLFLWISFYVHRAALTFCSGRRLDRLITKIRA